MLQIMLYFVIMEFVLLVVGNKLLLIDSLQEGRGGRVWGAVVV